MKTSCPLTYYGCWYVATKNARQAEKELHKKYQSSRIKNEWFYEFNKDDLAVYGEVLELKGKLTKNHDILVSHSELYSHKQSVLDYRKKTNYYGNDIRNLVKRRVIMGGDFTEALLEGENTTKTIMRFIKKVGDIVI